MSAVECNHCFQEEFQGGPFRCEKCGQQAMVFPVPVAKLMDMRDASEAGEWNASWLWHKMDRDETLQAGLVPYFEGVVTKLKQKRLAKQVLDVQRTVESCKQEPRRSERTVQAQKEVDMDALLKDLDLVL